MSNTHWVFDKNTPKIGWKTGRVIVCFDQNKATSGNGTGWVLQIFRFFGDFMSTVKDNYVNNCVTQNIDVTERNGVTETI